jgi:uncharacterized protein (TIGR03435 family)
VVHRDLKPGNIHQYVWPESLIGHLKDYDISATFPPNTRDEQVHLMLQRLLADRFKMVSHWETRETPVYALTVPKGGAANSEIGKPSGSQSTQHQCASWPGWMAAERSSIRYPAVGATWDYARETYALFQ